MCGLVRNCGSAVVRRSSQDHDGFGASLPITWSHPTLTGIELVTSTVSSYVLVHTYCREDQATHGFVPITTLMCMPSCLSSASFVVPYILHEPLLGS
jgi:hypothetical protein